MTTRGKAEYEVGAKDKTGPAFASLNRRLKSAEAAGSRFGKRLAAAAGPAALGLLTARSLKSIDSLAKFSDRVNISTEALRRLQFQTTLAGESNETMISSLQRMQKRLGEAAAGGGAALRFMEEFNLDVNKLNTLKADEQFEAIAEKISQLGTRNEQAAATAAIFGREGISMLTLIDQMGETAEQAADDVDKLGVSVSRVEAAQIEAANDSMSRTALIAEGLGNSIAIELSPLITAVGTELVESAKKAGGFKNEVKFAMDLAVGAVGVLADGVFGLNLLWKATKVALAEFVTATVSGIAGLDRVISDFLSNTLGLNVEASAFLQEVAASAQVTTSTFRTEFEKAASKARPSEAIGKFVEKAAETALEKAKEAAKKAEELGRADPGGGNLRGLDKRGAAQAKKDAAEKKRLSGRVDALRNSLLNEEAAELASFERKKTLLDEALAAELVTRQEHGQLLVDLKSERDINLNEKAASALEATRVGLLTEREVETEAFAARQAILDDALNRRLISRQRHQALSEKSVATHEKRLEGIEKRGLNDRQRFEKLALNEKAAFTLGSLSSILQGAGKHNRAAFNAAKIAGIGEAIVSTHVGVSKTLAAYPYPFNLLPAAAHLAAGVGQVNSIRSQSFGGGSVGSLSAGGGAVSIPSTPSVPDVIPGIDAVGQGEQQGRSFNIDITINGAIDSDFVRRELMPQIQQQLEDGAIAA